MWLKIYTRRGRPIAQLEPTSVKRSWRLNEIGKAIIKIPRTSDKAEPPLFQYGNLVLIESDDVHEWGGVLLPPRKWDQRFITLTAYSAERLLQGRLLPRTLDGRGSKAGAVFKSMVTHVSHAYQPNLTPGDIWGGGPKLDREWHYDDAWDAIRDLADAHEADLWIEPREDARGHLAFDAHWFYRRGSDKSKKIALIEGVNCSRATLRETGMITNQWVVIGSGDDWEHIPVGKYKDLDETDVTGMWSRSMRESDVRRVQSLIEMAHSLVQADKWARGRFQVRVLNDDSIWNKFRVGDFVRFESPTVGFDSSGEVGFRGPAKVISRALDESENSMPVVLEEVKGDVVDYLRGE